MTRVPSIYRDLAQVLTLMALVLCSGPVRASDWPTQAIRLVVPFAPGASNDILARALSKPLGDALGQTVVVENRPGSGGSIGANFVAKSRPDGYTLMLTSNALASASAVQDTPYDPASAQLMKATARYLRCFKTAGSIFLKKIMGILFIVVAP